MTLTKIISLVAICLAVYYAQTGNLCMTILYCCVLNWLKERIEEETCSKD